MRITFKLTCIVLLALMVASALLDLSWSNPNRISIPEVIDVLKGEGTWANTIIVTKINGPRIVTAIIVGASLATAGASMQALFRNPMASPYILGLSSGASLGAAIAMLFLAEYALESVGVPLLAFVFCLGTMLLVYSLSRIGGVVHTETLLLAGIAISAVLSAAVSFCTFISGDKIEGIVFWSLGSLGRTTWDVLAYLVPLLIAGIVMLICYSKPLNAMMLGDTHASNLGVNVNTVRFRILLLTTFVTAFAVAFVGSIGFVGLIIPHIFRIILGPDNRRLMPVCAVGGATFLLMCDYVSRTIAIQFGVLPIGIVTALVGAPYFVYLVRRRKNEVGW